MITYTHVVAGEQISVHVPLTHDDLRAFNRWVRERGDRPIALDTETTGLDIFSPGYRLRTVQFGDERTAWVLHWERGGAIRAAAQRVLEQYPHFLIHNAPFDWLVCDQHAGVSLESLAARTTDTRILATLVDPRQPQEGGIGTGLKPLSAHYVDASAPDTQAGLTAVFRSLGLTKATGWAGIPLDNEVYNLYAGLDCILTSRLYPIISEALAALGVRRVLVEYEHRIARMCAVMQRTGMVLDVDYVHKLRERLMRDEERYSEIAAGWGVDSVNSGAQVAEALCAMGETLTERTAGGALKVDKPILAALADVDAKKWTRLGLREPNPLADAVLRSKRAGKWRSAYADTFLETVDASGRVHPFINSLQARTGRMSITRPALQTLPSGDSLIRNAMLADEGHVIGATDFKAVEMRVLAALADVRRMKQAIAQGADLHDFTARIVFGDGFTEDHRKLCKGIGFGKVYGGGAATIQRQTGAPMAQVKAALTAYDRTYPEIRRASSRWQREARATGMVHVSVTGRRLPLDRDRTYAVVNYACQSAARDVLGQSLVNMDEAGLLPYLRLPVHDEVIISAPQREAEEIQREVARCMTFDLFGVRIECDGKLGGRAWGSLYGLAA